MVILLNAQGLIKELIKIFRSIEFRYFDRIHTPTDVKNGNLKIETWVNTMTILTMLTSRLMSNLCEKIEIANGKSDKLNFKYGFSGYRGCSKKTKNFCLKVTKEGNKR